MKFAIALALAVFTYHFEEKVTGYHPRAAEGTVLVAGKQFRIDYCGVVSTAQIGGDDRGVLAINDANQTWFPLHSQTPMPLGSLLFSFGMNPSVSKVMVAFTDAAKTHLQFSYDLAVTMGGEKVRGRVWGEMRVTAREGGGHLAWSPIAISTGLPDVDAAFRAQLAQMHGQVWKSETDVSRQIESGETLHQLITRTAGTLAPATANPEVFQVPAGYREQAPILAAPGK